MWYNSNLRVYILKNRLGLKIIANAAHVWKGVEMHVYSFEFRLNFVAEHILKFQKEI